MVCKSTILTNIIRHYWHLSFFSLPRTRVLCPIVWVCVCVCVILPSNIGGQYRLVPFVGHTFWHVPNMWHCIVLLRGRHLHSMVKLNWKIPFPLIHPPNIVSLASFDLVHHFFFFFLLYQNHPHQHSSSVTYCVLYVDALLPLNINIVLASTHLPNDRKKENTHKTTWIVGSSIIYVTETSMCDSCKCLERLIVARVCRVSRQLRFEQMAFFLSIVVWWPISYNLHTYTF